MKIQNGSTPKVTASVKNSIAKTQYGLTFIATVFDASNNAVGASQNVVSMLPSQGTSPLVFTWNKAFSKKAVRVEILPAVAP